MEVINHITFTAEKAPHLFFYLIQNNIYFENSTIFYVTDISETNPHWPNIQQIIDEEKDVICISETIFSAEELCSAQWLCVRSRWRFDYPQPEDSYDMVTYSQKGACPTCGSGLVQQAAFRFKREPKWGKRDFCMTNWVEDEFFHSSRAKELFEHELIPGISFQHVLDKKGKETFSDVHQMVISGILPNGLVEEQSCIREHYCCPHCGIKKYHPNGRGQYVFRKETFDNAPLISKTSELFGWESGASRLIIVHQSVYQLIKQNKMENSLVFEPIRLK